MEKRLDELYVTLFNAITSALDELEKSTVTTKETLKAMEILKTAQQKTEEIYINSGEKDVTE